MPQLLPYKGNYLLFPRLRARVCTCMHVCACVFVHPQHYTYAELSCDIHTLGNVVNETVKQCQEHACVLTLLIAPISAISLLTSAGSLVTFNL